MRVPSPVPILALAAAGATVGASAWAVRGVSSQVFGPSIYRGNTGERQIALTFDDGPSESTLPLLDYLAEEAVPATFFQVGVNVKRLPQVARAVLEAGHEIGNHTYSHARLCPTPPFQWPSPAFIAREVTQAQQAFADELGLEPSLFRAPFGARWFGLREAQQRLGLTGVMWTCIANDWKLPATGIADRVVSSATPDGIICLHDGRGTSVKPDLSELLAAMRLLIPRLKDMGYTFNTVSRIAGLGDRR